MNDEERKATEMQDAIIQKRKSLQIAYNLYKMGYAWNYKEALVNEGFKEADVESVCESMYEIFENALCSLNMMIGDRIISAYDNGYGHIKCDMVREAREYSVTLTKLMLDNGTRLYNDVESIQKGLLLYCTRYTLYEFGFGIDEAFTLSQMEQITD